MGQGTCGSCWAFATAEEVRYAHKRLYGVDPGPLSAQYLLDCSGQGGADGCAGGDTDLAIDFMIRNGGIPTVRAYGAYRGRKQTCKKNVPKSVIPGPAFSLTNEKQMYQYFCSHGPFTVSIDADGAVEHYNGGVILSSRCGTATNHRVVVVGLLRHQGRWAWVVQNSWGTNYGVTEAGGTRNARNGGFVLLQFGANTCGIAKHATFLSGSFTATGNGRAAWDHNKPLLQWIKSWGPYNGISFTGGGTHPSRQRTFAMCAARAEANGDSAFLYAPSTKACVTTGGSAGYGMRSTGRGALSTVYKKGQLPLLLTSGEIVVEAYAVSQYLGQKTMLLIALMVAILGSMAAILAARYAKGSLSSGPTDGYMQIE